MGVRKMGVRRNGSKENEEKEEDGEGRQTGKGSIFSLLVAFPFPFPVEALGFRRCVYPGLPREKNPHLPG